MSFLGSVRGVLSNLTLQVKACRHPHLTGAGGGGARGPVPVEQRTALQTEQFG